ncbi:MAG: hypothetical protein IKE25_09760 [Clostridia bacterium]|nr:hypothetical protein [Clostridia bacterium]
MQENSGWENGMETGSTKAAAGRIRRVDRFRASYDVTPGSNMAFVSRTAGQAGHYRQAGFMPTQSWQNARMEPPWSVQGNSTEDSRMFEQPDGRWNARSAIHRVAMRTSEVFEKLKARLAQIKRTPRSGRRGGIGKPAVLLTCLAVPLLGMGLMGIIGAGEFNRQLQEMGMGFISIDDALSSMKSLAGYTGRSLNDYFTGANGFILFAVTSRIPLLIAGAGSLVSGIISATMHRRNAAAQACQPWTENLLSKKGSIPSRGVFGL